MARWPMRLNPWRLVSVATRLLIRSLAMPGESIVHKGGRGRAIYFIATGGVEVRLDGRPARLGAGDFFGELALLTGRPRMADVVADGYCHLLVLEGGDFARLIRMNPRLRDEVEKIADTRLATNEGGQET